MPLRRLERKNMQLKKIALVFLVVIMMFSLAAISIAAEEAGSEFSLSAKIEADSALVQDPLAVKPGDIIKFVVSVDSNPGNLEYIEVRVKYDTTAFEYQGHTLGDIFEKNTNATTPIITPKETANGTLQCWLISNDKMYAPAKDKVGMFVTFTFKISESFHGNIEDLDAFYAMYNTYDDKGEKIALPESPAIKVHNYGEPTAVAGNCVNVGTTVYKCTKEGCDEVLTLHNGTLGDHKCEETNFHAAIAPGCVTEGQKAYYVCSNEGCGKNIAEDKVTVLDSLVVPTVGHKCDTLVGAVAPDCEKPGNVAYYVCGNSDCGEYIAEDKTTVLDDVVVPANGHTYGELIAKVPATTEKEGSVAHYLCSVCEKYFNEGKTEISSIVIPKLPKMISVPENSVWVKGSDVSLNFVSNAKFEDFVKVSINGVLLEKGGYKLEKGADGSTSVTLEPAYLEHLEPGDYTIAIESANGSCEADFTVEANNSVVIVIIVIIAVLLIVGGVVAAIVVLKKKKII